MISMKPYPQIPVHLTNLKVIYGKPDTIEDESGNDTEDE